MTKPQLYTEQHLENLVEESATTFQNIYLEWVNDWLTLPAFAAYYDMSVEQARRTIDIGRKIHEQRVKNLKEGVDKQAQSA